MTISYWDFCGEQNIGVNRDEVTVASMGWEAPKHFDACLACRRHIEKLAETKGLERSPAE